MNLRGLLTEQINPASQGIDARSTTEILEIINQEDQQVALAVAAEIPKIAPAVDQIVGGIGKGGRLFYIGAGTSGRLVCWTPPSLLPRFMCLPTWCKPLWPEGTRPW